MNASGTNAPASVISVLLFGAALLIFRMNLGSGWLTAIGMPALLLVGAILVRLSLLMAKQWERAVVLRLGKLHAIRGPGMFMIVPFVDSVTARIDQRIQTTPFNAEQSGAGAYQGYRAGKYRRHPVLADPRPGASRA